MKKKRAKRMLSLLLACVLCTSQIPAGWAAEGQATENLIADPGFEEGSDLWQPWLGGEIIVDASLAYEGEACAKVSTVSDAVPQVIPKEKLKPNTTYTLTAMAKATEGGKAVIGVEKFGKENVYSEDIASEEWKEYSVEFTTGETLTDTTTVTLTQWAFASSPADGACYADCFTLTEKESGLPDLSSLLSIIDTAKGLTDAAVAGTEPGQYPANAISRLSQAIAEAEAFVDSVDDSTTLDAIGEAEDKLNEEIDIFANSQIIGGDPFQVAYDFSLKSQGFEDPEAILPQLDYQSSFKWFPYLDATICDDPALAYEGEHCAKLSTVGSTWEQNISGLQPNTTYVIKGYVKIQATCVPCSAFAPNQEIRVRKATRKQRAMNISYIRMNLQPPPIRRQLELHLSTGQIWQPRWTETAMRMKLP